MSNPPTHLHVGWTTLASADEAESLARTLLEAKLVACAQIDGPITSLYHWEDAIARDTEYRLTLKYPSPLAREVEACLHKHHPYTTPQWVVIASDTVSPDYAAWADQSTQNPRA